MGWRDLRWIKHDARVFAAADVVHVEGLLANVGVSWCLVGGWGVDALLGLQTRPHKDLDVLIDRASLEPALEVLLQAGYRHAYTWEENRPIGGDGPGAGRDSAFVLADRHGHEIDIHVYDVLDGQVSPLWDADRALNGEDLAAEGVIAGRTVRCMTPQKQLEVHQGYELPSGQRDDVVHLRRLTSRNRFHR
jgi:lincosamide nucleotidyltransferase A/C/D/E